MKCIPHKRRNVSLAEKTQGSPSNYREPWRPRPRPRGKLAPKSYGRRAKKKPRVPSKPQPTSYLLIPAPYNSDICRSAIHSIISRRIMMPSYFSDPQYHWQREKHHHRLPRAHRHDLPLCQPWKKRMVRLQSFPFIFLIVSTIM